MNTNNSAICHKRGWVLKGTNLSMIQPVKKHIAVKETKRRAMIFSFLRMTWSIVTLVCPSCLAASTVLLDTSPRQSRAIYQPHFLIDKNGPEAKYFIEGSLNIVAALRRLGTAR
jgi:hypothetical protein